LARPVSPEDRSYGAFLMAIGGLMAGLCGACTLASFRTFGAGLPLIVGGIPALLGVVLFRAGFRRYRGTRDPDHPGMFD
jgi:hypothetical protein